MEARRQQNLEAPSERAHFNTAEWMAGVDKVVRRLRPPPAGYTEHTEDGRETMHYALARNPDGAQMFGWLETGVAANVGLGWVVECPFGVAPCFKDTIRAAST